MGLISELRRRNVLRMVVLYAVAAWLIMQVAEVIIGLANLPEWIGPTILGLLAVGFPIALIFSWFYELTPEGISLEKDVAAAESIMHVTSRRMDFIVISLLCAAVILFTYDKWWIGPPPEQSIAVLPFVNMSNDPDNEYFSDGISEELLNVLAKIEDFRVTGRTSSFSFKGKDTDIQTIGEKLHVQTILEGSVRKAGDQVRITAQLVNVEDGYRLWSETYDRNLNNIFEVQDEIAIAVVSALRLELPTRPAPSGRTGGVDPTAYRHYLQGRFLAHGSTAEEIDLGLAHLRETSRLDPSFAPAYAAIADAMIVKAFFSTSPSAEIVGEARTAAQSAMMVRSIMNDKQIKEFDATKECNFAISPQGIGRFRVSAFIQQGLVGAVLRTITTEIPTLNELDMPPILKDVVMNKRGLVIVVGGTGSGKSTSLAAMIGHRNENSKGHIISIEDPIEYVHPHKGCVITQREVGVDTDSWHAALKNTLRQAPDVIMIGEIRDRETMEYGIQFAETGHLCLATLHANSANQALDRIINFFSEERRQQLLMDLSLNTKAIVSQRLIPREGGVGRIAAMEILLNTPLIADLIFKGEVSHIKEIMAKSTRLGMQTFDQALFTLYEDAVISYEEAMRNADSKNELRLRVKLESKRDSSISDQQTESLKIMDEDTAQTF